MLVAKQVPIDRYPIPDNDELCTKCGAKTETDLGCFDSDGGKYEMDIYCRSCGTEWVTGNIHGDKVWIKESQ